MKALREIGKKSEVRQFKEAIFEYSEVQGFSLGVHPEFISMFRGEFSDKSHFTINQILEDGSIPTNWREFCNEAGYSEPLSPVYIVVYVAEGTDIASFSRRAGLPRTINDDFAQEVYAVIVEHIAPFRESADTRNHRPLIGGISTGSNSNRNLSGTLGGFLKDENGNVYILSCAHVLGSVQDFVVQRAAGDGGKDIVADTSHLTQLNAHQLNDTDAGIATVRAGIGVQRQIRLLGLVTQTVDEDDLELDDPLIFVGKESDRQEARVYSYLRGARN